LATSDVSLRHLRDGGQDIQTADANAGMIEVDPGDTFARMMIFKNSCPYTLQGLPGQIPNHKISVKKLLYGKDG
jgi:hypothetical protein